MTNTFGSILSSASRDRLSKAVRLSSGALQIDFLASPAQTPWDAQMRTLCNELSTYLQVAYSERSAAVDEAAPQLMITRPSRGRVRYLALATAKQEAPLIEFCIALLADEPPQTAWMSKLLELDEPATLELFVSRDCPHCPQLVQACAQLAAWSPKIDLTVIDVEHHPAQAAEKRVQSVPTLWIDNRVAVFEVQPSEAIVELLGARGQPEHDEQSLRSLLESGRFKEAARRIADPAGQAAFVSLWNQSTMALRIGLLLSVENALELFPHALDAAVTELKPALQNQDDPALRGDTADLLARIGHPDALPAIELLCSDPNPEVAEAAAEAAERLRQPRLAFMRWPHKGDA